jgi:ATP-dependent helicase/nuclease subunit A
MHRTEGVALKPPAGAEGKAFSRICALNEAQEAEEETRILYVAATRARNHLIITGGDSEKSARPTFMKWVLQYRSAHCLYIKETGAEAEEAEVAEEAAEEVAAASAGAAENEAHTAVPALIVPPAEAGFIYPYPEDLTAPLKTTVTLLNAAAAKGLIPEDAYESEHALEGARAADMGSAWHTVLRLIDFNRRSDGEIEAELVRIGALNAVPPDLLAKISVPKLRLFFRSGIPEMADKADKVLRERSFLLSKGGTIVQGMPDIILLYPDGLTVIDYKLSVLSGSDLRRFYACQLDLYASAASAAFNLPAQKYLYSINTGRLIEV